MNDKIPGCDQLTRPEEISALSKFLRHIREVQEEHVGLDESVIEMGDNQNKEDKLEELPKDIDKIPSSTTDDKLKNLSTKKDTLNVIEKAKTLSDHLEELEGAKKNIPLSNEKINLEVKDKINLDDTKVSLKVEDNNTLDDTKVNLDVNPINNLDDTRVNLRVEDNNILDDTKVNLSIENNNDLDNTKIDLNINNDNNLNDTKIKLEVEEDNFLSNTKIGLTVEDNNTLDNTIVDLSVDNYNSLDDYLEHIIYGDNTGKISELSDYVDKLTPDSTTNNIGVNIQDAVTELDNFISALLENDPDNKDRYLNISELEVNDDNALKNYYSDGPIQIEPSSNVDEAREDGHYHYLNIEDGLDLVGNLVSIPSNNPDDEAREDSQYHYLDIEEGLDLIGNISKLPESIGDNARENGGYNYFDTNQDNENDNSRFIALKTNYYNSVIPGEKTSEARESGGYDFWNLEMLTDNFETFSGAIASGDIDYYKKKFLNYARKVSIPDIQVPENTTRLISSYIRYEASNLVNNSKNENLQELALWGLILARRYREFLTLTDKSILPGRADYIAKATDETIINKDYTVALKAGWTVARAALGRFTNEKPLPINRPVGKTTPSMAKTEATFKNPTVNFESANSRISSQTIIGYPSSDDLAATTPLWLESISTSSPDLYQLYNFSDNYLNGNGIKQTLEELCLTNKTVLEIQSVEQLFETLKSSPYITTPRKFGTDSLGRYRVQTLDNDCYWEIIMKPLCNKELNGGFSYLPSIEEINVRNINDHGYNTDYNNWIPIQKFDLSKSRVTTKTVQLYGGDISFPISPELTNELRISVVDDQFKSWRTYFQTCMDASVYLSEAHGPEYYYIDSAERVINKKDVWPTAINKNVLCAAFYKNITFKIDIYILTPQYSTIRKFSLLAVLKDFSEEYTGEVSDIGGGDLELNFSIVGEQLPYTNNNTKELKEKIIPSGTKEKKSKFLTMAKKALGLNVI